MPLLPVIIIMNILPIWSYLVFHKMAPFGVIYVMVGLSTASPNPIIWHIPQYNGCYQSSLGPLLVTTILLYSCEEYASPKYDEREHLMINSKHPQRVHIISYQIVKYKTKRRKKSLHICHSLTISIVVAVVLWKEYSLLYDVVSWNHYHIMIMGWKIR